MLDEKQTQDRATACFGQQLGNLFCVDPDLREVASSANGSLEHFLPAGHQAKAGGRKEGSHGCSQGRIEPGKLRISWPGSSCNAPKTPQLGWIFRCPVAFFVCLCTFLGRQVTPAFHGSRGIPLTSEFARARGLHLPSEKLV